MLQLTMFRRFAAVIWLLWSGVVYVKRVHGWDLRQFSSGQSKESGKHLMSRYLRNNETCGKPFRELPATHEDGINYCVKLNGDELTSRELHFPSKTDLTFEFDIKLDKWADSCVHIFSFEAEAGSALRLQACPNVQTKIASLNLQYSALKVKPPVNGTSPLKFEIKLAAWYRVAVVWRRSDSVLEIIALNIDGGTLFSSHELAGLNMFEEGGFVTFGSFRDSYQPKSRGLWIAEAKIWKRAFTVNDLQKNFETKNTKTETGLLHEWRFSKGAGEVINGHVAKNSLRFVQKSFRADSWTVCLKGSLDEQARVAKTFQNLTSLELAEAFCVDIIYHDAMMASCSRHLPPSVPQRFYANCVDDVAENGDVTKAVDALRAFAKYCEISLCLTLWPAYPVCNDMPKKISPVRCFQKPDLPCYSGTTRSDGTCECEHGWFGQFCSMVCPGGIENTCGGVGKCDQQTGSCRCPVNFNQTSNCSTCSPGFVGKNCTVFLADSRDDLELETAAAYGYGRYITFGGVVFTLPSSGEFAVFRSEDVEVYVKQMPTSDINGHLRFHIGQIWIKTKGNNVAISLSTENELTHRGVTVSINGKKAELVKGREHGISLNEGQILWKISDDWFELDSDWSNAPVGKKRSTYIRAHANNGAFDLYITRRKRLKVRDKLEKEGSKSGLLYLLEFPRGLKSSNKTNERKYLTNEYDIREVAQSATLPSNEASRFTQDILDGYTYGGNCLRLRNYGNTTSPPAVFTDKLGDAVSLERDLSIELYIKVENDGVFFTYEPGSNEAGFSLAYLGEKFKIGIHGGNWTNTGIRIPPETAARWGMITINCERGAGNVWLYYTSTDGTTHNSEVLKRDHLQSLTPEAKKAGGLVWFSQIGSISLGDRNLNEGLGFKSEFSGAVDEMRIWDRALTKFQTKQNFGVKFFRQQSSDPTRTWEPRLKAVWNFDEGRGEISRNLISDNHIRIVTSTPPSGVSWAPSDAPVFPQFPTSTESCKCTSDIDPPFAVYVDDDTKWAEVACRDALGPLMSNALCGQSLKNKEDIFVTQCMEDVLRQNFSGQAELLSDVYVGICRFTLNLTDPCTPNPCKNYGSCKTVKATDYQCDCSCGYTGKNCEVEIDECESTPCLNGAKCDDGICKFTCGCPTGYVGKLCQRKCVNPLGFESRLLPDSYITASSEYQTGMPWYISYLACRARLNQRGWGGGWVPKLSDKDPWLQVSFPEPMRITGMALQGVNWNGHDAWTSSFAISISRDSASWRGYGENFEGNNRSGKAVVNMFNPPIVGQYFRVEPITYHIRPSIRMEFYGCPACDCCRELGMESFDIADSQISASSVSGADCERCSDHTAAWPHFGRLDGPRNKYADLNLWMAKKDDPCPWIMVDLLKPHNVNGVIVQGGNYYRYPIYTSSFTVAHSLDNETWIKLPEIFEGNSDSTSHRKVVFEEAVQSRFVKLELHDWRNHPGMRFELLGCFVGEQKGKV